MSTDAERAVWPQDVAGHGSRHVFLPDVGAVGVDRDGERGVVVDDDRHVSVATDRDGPRQLVVVGLNRPPLDDVDAAHEGPPQGVSGFVEAELGGEQ